MAAVYDLTLPTCKDLGHLPDSAGNALDFADIIGQLASSYAGGGAYE
jgi:hypothetical protein